MAYGARPPLVPKRFSQTSLGLSSLGAAAVLWCASGCHDPRERAAKQRIFSPEDPPKVVASAQEPLPPEQLGAEPRLAERVLTMGAAEMAERLGAHRFSASVSFDWSTPSAAPVKLTESRLLEADARGVNGDFHAKVDNNQELGLEVIRVAGEVYARNRFGKYRLRRRDRGMAERTREDVVAPLSELDALFDRRMKLLPQGVVTYEGRPALRYEVSLASAAPKAASATLPALLQPKGGVDETTRRRLAFLAQKSPKSLKGEVLVDQATSVVLRASLDGRLDVPGQGGTGPAALRVTLEQKVTRIGQPLELKVPPDARPDVDKPLGIADALDRFGIPRGGKADAGAEPDDDDG
jgi:hypothetical protein